MADIITGLQNETGNSLGDVNFVYETSGGKAYSWSIVRTGRNVLDGNLEQQAMTKGQAFEYLKDNGQEFINDGKSLLSKIN